MQRRNANGAFNAEYPITQYASVRKLPGSIWGCQSVLRIVLNCLIFAFSRLLQHFVFTLCLCSQFSTAGRYTDSLDRLVTRILHFILASNRMKSIIVMNYFCSVEFISMSCLKGGWVNPRNFRYGKVEMERKQVQSKLKVDKKHPEMPEPEKCRACRREGECKKPRRYN